MTCVVKSGGIDALGKLTLFFQDYCDPFSTSHMLFDQPTICEKPGWKLAERKEVGETV